MSDFCRRTRRWSWVLALTMPLVLGCSADQPVSPTLAPGSETPALRAHMSGAALFVGNFSPPPGLPTNGVLRYDASGAFVDNLIPEGREGLTIACCMTFGPDENLYVGSPLTSNVLRFNGVTGDFIDEFIPAGSGGLVAPLVLLFRDGKLYVGDVVTHSIRRYDATTGAFIDEFVASGSGGMGEGDPQEFNFGPDGNLYVASPATNQVLRFDGKRGKFMDVFIGSDAVSAPDGLTFGPHGDLYVVSGNGVNRYNGKTGRLIDRFVSQGSGGLVAPVGIRFGPDDNFYAASSGPEEGTGQVLRYDKRGRFLDVFVPNGRGGMSGPRTIEFKSTIALCHRHPGKRGKAETITVDYLSAVKRVAHGDEVGPCADGGEERGEGD